jgi:hypothetical protein
MRRVGDQVYERVGRCDEEGPEFSAAPLCPNFRKLGGIGHVFDPAYCCRPRHSAATRESPE